MAELLADVLLYGGFLIAQLLRQGVYFGQQRLDARGQFVLTCLADFWGCFFQVLRQCVDMTGLNQSIFLLADTCFVAGV